MCDKGYIWNPSNCECECNKSCGIGEYLDFKSCVCKNTLIDKLVEECTSVIDGTKIYNETLNTISSDDCASCTLYVVLFGVFVTTSVIIGGVFAYFHWYKNIMISHTQKIVFVLNLIQLLKQQIIECNSVKHIK